MARQSPQPPLQPFPASSLGQLVACMRVMWYSHACGLLTACGVSGRHG